ncbi:MAG: N-acetyltransferase [Acidobacteria bacterium]|nr:MAG: N-acetyltransferase [Acidobacteriota bacterium]
MNDREIFIHPQAIVETSLIGEGTRVWPFTHVLKGARLGKNCNVGEQCYIESDVIVGDDVVIKNGVSLWEGVRIEDRVFLGPGCVFTNDLVPRSKLFKPRASTLVREGASIGANATILCGLEIGVYALVAAGAVVTRNVPDFALVVGNPARLRGFVCRCGNHLDFNSQPEALCDCGSRYFKEKNNAVYLMSEACVEKNK